MKKWIGGALAGVAVAACAAACVDKWDAVDPRSQQAVSGNPCGNLWHVCYDMAGKDDGTCCPETTTCGGGKWSVGCGVDSCCYLGQSEPEARRTDGGVDGAPVLRTWGAKRRR
jgi:hypothetical protein